MSVCYVHLSRLNGVDDSGRVPFDRFRGRHSPDFPPAVIANDTGNSILSVTGKLKARILTDRTAVMVPPATFQRRLDTFMQGAPLIVIHPIGVTEV